MYKQNLVLNNVQGLICHKTQANQTTMSRRLLSFGHLGEEIVSLDIYQI